ncbi:hypothetical protein [Dysgonomonas sp. 520]|uniref:hypothetical protein n=1 Tax=Dysgonomonas sp. 520 TaxID=2302931 RepID=UPI0013D1649B|nr:hypothetical protein [Dysgonomonas sp. 520]NDW09180.1 hypothetical protein [Dysgonomonas sp. 520]
MSLINLGDGSRKAQIELYGNWFSLDGNAKYYTNKCETLIKNYEVWMKNLEEVLASLKQEELKAREDEIRQFLSRYTPEEIAAFQNGSGD